MLYHLVDEKNTRFLIIFHTAICKFKSNTRMGLNSTLKYIRILQFHKEKHTFYKKDECPTSH